MIGSKADTVMTGAPHSSQRLCARNNRSASTGPHGDVPHRAARRYAPSQARIQKHPAIGNLTYVKGTQPSLLHVRYAGLAAAACRYLASPPLAALARTEYCFATSSVPARTHDRKSNAGESFWWSLAIKR